MYSSQDAKEQIRQAVDIVDLVGGYIQLRRQGRNYVGTCPWHDDSRPSLQVNQERQSWKCWVCDVGGDIFSFLMKIDRLEFPEALEVLAERAGIKLQSSPNPQANAGGPGDKKTLLAALAWAEDQLHRCLLNDPVAEPARRYLDDRGITEESIRKFRLGFSPPQWDWLVNRSRETSYSLAVLDRIGMILERNVGEGWYDRFRCRVMFPIRDVRSRPIAFGGRIMPQFADDRSAKYVNSPETPLFSKSSQLYALDQPREGITRRGQAVVMEGYTDVIMAHQCGVDHAIAVLGTALGEKHLPLLRRFTDRIALVLDGDEAGQRRTNEILELFVSQQIDLRILTLPGGLDPCDFLAEQGGERFLELLGQAVDALEHKFRTQTRGLDTDRDTHQASIVLKQLLETLAKSRRGIGQDSSAQLLREQQFLTRIAREFRLPEEQIRSRLRDLRRGQERRALLRTPDASTTDSDSTEKNFKLSDVPAWEQEFFEVALTDEQAQRTLIRTFAATDFSLPLTRWLFQTIAERETPDQGVTIADLMSAIDDSRIKSLLVQLEEALDAKAGSDRQLRLTDLVARQTNQRDERIRQEQFAALRDKRVDGPQEEQLLHDIFAQLKRRQAGSLSTDGEGV